MNGTRYYMKDEIPFQDFSAYTEKTGSKKGLAAVVVLILLIAAGIGGVYVLGQNRSSESQLASIPTEVPTPTDTPTPTSSTSATITATPSGRLTPTPTGAASKLDRANLRIAILNGSGVAGAGRRYSTYLGGLGYVVTSTGNADTFDYSGITVKVKKAKSDFASLLKKDLSTFATGSAITTSVDDTIQTDAAIIVGK